MSSYRLGSINGPQFTVKYKPENSEKKLIPILNSLLILKFEKKAFLPTLQCKHPR